MKTILSIIAVAATLAVSACSTVAFDADVPSPRPVNAAGKQLVSGSGVPVTGRNWEAMSVYDPAYSQYGNGGGDGK